MQIFLFATLLFAIMFARPASADPLPINCHGTPALGSLQEGWQLPSKGENYSTYGPFEVFAGRNYVHSKVYEVVVNAYQQLETQAPGRLFIYGETGLKNGGRFWPHQSHQNGLSVDFFVPVVDKQGGPAILPISVFNEFGYKILFNDQGEHGDLTIDFEMVAKHIRAIKKAADAAGVGIIVVIVENALQKS